MRLRLTSLSAILGVLVCSLPPVLCTIACGCSREAGGTTRPGATAEATESARVRFVEAKATELRRTWRISGALEPAETARAAFLLGGRLIEVRVERGERVEQGQILARLDTAEVRAGVAQARAAVAAADAQVRLTEDALARLEPLNREQAVAEAQVVKVRLQLEATRAMRDQARSALAMARVKQDQHTLRAPIAGTVLDVPETLGEIVGPGIPQFEIADLTRLEVQGTLPVEAAGRVREGQNVTVAPGEGEPIDGRISSVLPALTADTHRLPIEVEVTPPPGRPGLANAFVEVEIRSAEVEAAVTIPATSVVREDDTWVFVLAEGEVVRRRPVRVYANEGDDLIVGGIEPGSQVVDMPGVDLTDGTRVQR